MLRFLTVTSALALTCAMAPAQTIYYVDGSCGDDRPKRILKCVDQ